MMLERVNSPTSDFGRTVGNAFVRKLSSLALLSQMDLAALAGVCAHSRWEPARKDLVHEDLAPSGALVLLEGFACRYRRLSDGGRQILSFLLPGDLCDLDHNLPSGRDYAIGTLSVCNVAWISSTNYSELLSSHSTVAAALRTAKLLEEAILRDWLVGLGRRHAPERLARLLCELLERAQAVGLASADRCHLPIMQVDFGDATGLSTVHISRSLQALRLAGLLEIVARRLHVIDLPRLHAFCEFSPMRARLGDGFAVEASAITWGAA